MLLLFISLMSSIIRLTGTARPVSGSCSWRLTPKKRMDRPLTKNCPSLISTLRNPTRQLSASTILPGGVVQRQDERIEVGRLVGPLLDVRHRRLQQAESDVVPLRVLLVEDPLDVDAQRLGQHGLLVAVVELGLDRPAFELGISLYVASFGRIIRTPSWY